MKRKVTTILMADIVGYSRHVAEDEEETLQRLASYRSVIEAFVAKASGRIFNTAGDAFCVEFLSAVEALRCAIDIQESLRIHDLKFPLKRRIEFRIGIAIGDVVVESDGDLLGNGVNIAQRLQTLAEPGGICISRSVYEQVAKRLSVQFIDIGEQQVKNIPDRIYAYRVATNATKPPIGSARNSSRAPVFRSALLATILLAIVAALVGLILAYPAITPTPPTAAPQNVPNSSKPGQVAAETRSRELQIDEAAIQARAKSQGIPLPEKIRVIQPSSTLREELAKYIGVWGGNARWIGVGRYMMLLVTHIDDSGNAIGFYSVGPPTAHSLDQFPAAFSPFTGRITDVGLKFEAWRTTWKYTFKIRRDGTMEGQAETPKNTLSTIVIDRIDKGYAK